MANNFVKWWKTKFLNSYKQFADGSYGKISDTEELLGSISAETEDSQENQLRISCSTPPINQKTVYSNAAESSTHPQPPQTSHQCQNQPTSIHQNLNLEQFSCDVSVEDGVDKRGQQRQEFSFTLYDFDGYGKITKDDIAGLVTTIYEALGSSVKVPHYGSKTIRVKLTVSPDQRKHVSATVLNQQREEEVSVPAEEPPLPGAPKRTKRRSKQCRTSARRTCRYHRCCETTCNRECVNVSDVASVTSSGASGDISSDEERDCRFSCPDTRKKVYRKTNQQPEAGNKDSDAENKHLRSSSLQRQELLEIIRANMNKNNLCLKSARKPCTNGDGAVRDTQRKPRRIQRGHSRIPTLQALANIMDPTHFYVDLGSFQNATQLPNNNLQYNKLIDAVMCVSNKRPSAKRVCRKHKSRVIDGWQMAQSINVIPNSSSIAEKGPRRAKCNEGFRRNGKKVPQIVLGNAASPHYLKHRNRQEDQARAMAQVVKWLEQQFSSNLHEEAAAKKTKAGGQKAANSDGASNSTVEKHEHHHVHEHIHHHYHHYQDVPIVV